MNFTLNPQGLVDVLPVLGQGLFGVFVVIAVIWLAIAGLTRMSR